MVNQWAIMNEHDNNLFLETVTVGIGFVSYAWTRGQPFTLYTAEEKECTELPAGGTWRQMTWE
jgi:hypothetical protein